MDEVEVFFVNMLEVLINDIKSGRWSIKHESINIENNFEEHCSVPLYLHSKTYDIKVEIEPNRWDYD